MVPLTIIKDRKIYTVYCHTPNRKLRLFDNYVNYMYESLDVSNYNVWGFYYYLNKEDVKVEVQSLLH